MLSRSANGWIDEDVIGRTRIDLYEEVGVTQFSARRPVRFADDPCMVDSEATNVGFCVAKSGRSDAALRSVEENEAWTT